MPGRARSLCLAVPFAMRLQNWVRAVAVRARMTMVAMVAMGIRFGRRRSEIDRPGALPQNLLLRGSRLPEGTQGGYVVVFDDVTRLVAAQRSAAWGRWRAGWHTRSRNPLTPIQLSAERVYSSSLPTR